MGGRGEALDLVDEGGGPKPNWAVVSVEDVRLGMEAAGL